MSEYLNNYGEIKMEFVEIGMLNELTVCINLKYIASIEEKCIDNMMEVHTCITLTNGKEYFTAYNYHDVVKNLKLETRFLHE